MEEQVQTEQTETNFVANFPEELVEEIFNHLSMSDLKNCAAVNIKWRETANRTKFWKTLCITKNISDPLSFHGIESNFMNKKRQFQFPENDSPRLSPVNDWKMLYCQTNFIRSNWKRGRFAIHYCGRNIYSQCKVSFSSKSPADRLHLPVVEVNSDRSFNLVIVRLDGKPRVVQSLVVSDILFPAVCANRDCIVYVNENIVNCCKWKSDEEMFDDSETLGTVISGIEGTNVTEREFCNPSNYILTMDDDYIIAGFNKAEIKIWCRRTNVLKIVIKLPSAKTVFSSYCLYDGRFFFGCNRESDTTYFVRNYDIAEEEWASDIPLSNPVKRILCDDRYLLIGLKENVNGFLITLRERRTDTLLWSIRQDSSQNWGMLEPLANLFEDHVFFLEAFTINVLSASTGKTVKEFTVNSTIQGLENVHGDLILLRSRNEVELWNWREGVKLYTPGLDCADTALYIDDTRLIFVGQGKEIKVVGYW